MRYTLYLASTSPSRKMLLTEAKIPFTLIAQSADEYACDWNQSLQKVVESIACHKMEHLDLPKGEQGDICYVLTADTLTENKHGVLEGKPVNRQDAIAKLQSAREGVCTGTAFCLDRRIYNNNGWHVDKRVVQYVQAAYRFIVADQWLDFYFEHTASLGTCAIAIEGFGSQFLQDINGSYTAVIGLPMYELRNALTELGFFNS